VATSALGLAIVLQIYKNYGSVEENEIKKEELKENS
jgi:NADH:ubiquinone oxidoreductase subunit K